MAAKPLFAVLEPLIKDGQMTLNIEDELIAGCLISNQGELRHEDVLSQGV